MTRSLSVDNWVANIRNFEQYILLNSTEIKRFYKFLDEYTGLSRKVGHVSKNRIKKSLLVKLFLDVVSNPNNYNLLVPWYV